MTARRKQRYRPDRPTVRSTYCWSPGHISSRDDFIEASVSDSTGKRGHELYAQITRTDLIEFLTLRNADAKRIAEYAKDRGILGMSETGDATTDQYCEPASDWRDLAAAFDSALTITMHLDNGLRITAEAWTPLQRFLSHHEQLPLPVRSASTKDRERLGSAVNAMLQSANVGPVLIWGSQQWLVEITARRTLGIYGGLVLRLAEMIVGANQFAVCSHCAKIFIPSRKPAEGRRSFCPKCQNNKIPLLYAKRDQLRRKEEQDEEES
jgi:hypothetical protein